MALWDDYINAVVSGEIKANEFVKQACKRHLDDLKDAESRGLYFDEETALRAIKFFSILKHSIGEWAGQRIKVEPWQAFFLAMLFGWKKADGVRRYKTGYLEVARKNGKSTMLAGVGLYLLVADGEDGAEIYTAATKREQARITHGEAERMVKSSSELSKRLIVQRNNIFIPNSASKFVPLGKDSKTLDGLNVHGAIVDELHAHPNRDMIDILETATGARRQPLIVAITTAGQDRQSVCFEYHEYTAKVLSGIIQDDSFFGLIYGLDEGDDWTDESNWIKANPNLGVSKKLKGMKAQAEKAKNMPTALNAFLRLELNVWTKSETKWLSVEKWQRCNFAVNAEGLKGRTCYAGLDLASTKDITAFVLVFPPQSKGDKWQILPRFWLPDEAMRERSKRDRVPYDVWVRQGFISATSGNVVDYDFVVEQIKKDAATYDIKEIAFDPWNATQLSNDLQKEDVAELVQFRQGYQSMSPPMKEMERLILKGELAHGNNPVLNWMADNLVATEDPAGNIKPDKAKSTEKIDGMVALIMAIDRATKGEDNVIRTYDKRGIRTL